MGFRGKVILLVDDEPVVRLALRDILERQAYVVYEAGSYEEALREVDERGLASIDLLLTDVAMPGKTGCELAKDLLVRQPNLKVLFISGYTGAEACWRYGIDVNGLHFLPKPFGTVEIVERVKQVMQAPDGVPKLFRMLSGE